LKKVLEGYLYCIPFMGDAWVLTERKMRRRRGEEIWKWEERVYREGKDIADILLDFEGRKVRVTVEVLEE